MDKKHICKICNRKFTRGSNLNTHINTKHNNVSLTFSCYLCRKNFRKQEKYLKHIERHKEGLNYILYKRAFDGLGIAVAKNPFHVNDGGKAANDGKLLGSCLLVQLL